MKAVLWNAETGEIVQRITGSGPALHAAAASAGLEVLPVPTDQPYERTHRVVGGQLVEKEV